MLNEDSVIKIVEEIEREGGELLAETHAGTPITYVIEGQHGREKKVAANTTACAAEMLVQIPYLGEPTDEEIAPEAGMMRACIGCDRMDLWPRYSMLRDE